MKDSQKVLKDALDQVKTIDPHCHLNMEKPSANNLADIILYHHVWIELVSSGMGQFEVTKSGLPHELQAPDITAIDRVRRSLKYLLNLENTTIGLLLRWILQDLYDVEKLSESNIETVFDLVDKRGKDPNWLEEVLRNRCHIEYNISVEYNGNPYNSRLLKGREVYATNIVDGKRNASEILEAWQDSFGQEISNAQQYVDFLKKIVDSLLLEEYKFIGLWVLPNLSFDYVRTNQITQIFKKIKNNESLSQIETGGLCYFGLSTLLGLLRKTPLRLIQLIVGAKVLPPHRSITNWNGTFCGAIARLANEFEDFHFNMSSASDLYTQDMGILAKHFPNLSVAGYWWHTLYPFYLKKSIETRLDMVPINKIVAFFSDAYHAEWCYPKLKMVKQVLGQILLERIEKKWYNTDIAIDIINKIFYGNPLRIYGITP
jgi:predicted TIM-barrel fold metal-dependent hydrolase